MPDYVTLADISAVARAEGNFLKSGVIDALRMDANILDMLPFAPANALKAQGLRIWGRGLGRRGGFVGEFGAQACFLLWRQ